MSTEQMGTYEKIYFALWELGQRYGNFVQFRVIGRSHDERMIPMLEIGKGDTCIICLSGVESGDRNLPEYLLSIAKDYCRSYESNWTIGESYEVRKLLDKVRICMIPMLNPDGAELQIHGCDSLNPLTERLTSMSGGDFSRWQANGRGVDLNHNYNAGFAEYKLLEPSLGIHGGAPTRFSGAYPESEPETSALCGFIRATDVSMLLALHTQGGEIYADYNGLVPPGGSVIAERMSALSGYKVAKPEPAACYGGLKDWYILEFNRPGFTIECGYGKNPLPESDGGIVYSQIRKILLHAPTMI